ncbi:MAG: hypothetical protein E7L08_24105, partial [Klebsiella michiganensis]|nr:hypothetical protein [Klebsiella michiganensis]
QPWLLVLIAIIGNSLGGVTNVILGRLFPLRKTSRWQEKATGWLRRYGAVTLLLSWAPVIGDLLCLLAGWMRISWGPVLFKRFRQAGGQIDPGRITGAGLAGKKSAGAAGYSTWS